MPQNRQRPAVRTQALRGFSLVEMLVVLLILTVVISIVIPALQSFRNGARKSATQSLMASFSTSVSQFRLSQSRLPGHFSARDMGSGMNAGGGGLSMMENLMLDLAGGITTEATSNGNGNTCDPAGFPIIEVGPDNNNKVNVNINRIGATESNNKAEVVRTYFKPDPKYFVRQCRPNNRVTGANDARAAMPVLVDAWGQPILAWAADDVPPGSPLASLNSGTRARFYWASNAEFTRATSLGKLGQDQADLTTGSMLGSPGAGALAGVVGNPSFAGEARAPVVLHSAGANGVYLGRSERGGKANQAVGNGNPTLSAVGRDYFAEGDFDDVIGKAE